MVARRREAGAGGQVLIFTPSPWRPHRICMPEVWTGSACESARDETRRCANLMGTQAFGAIVLAAAFASLAAVLSSRVSERLHVPSSRVLRRRGHLCRLVLPAAMRTSGRGGGCRAGGAAVVTG